MQPWKITCVGGRGGDIICFKSSMSIGVKSQYPYVSGSLCCRPIAGKVRLVIADDSVLIKGTSELINGTCTWADRSTLLQDGDTLMIPFKVVSTPTAVVFGVSSDAIIVSDGKKLNDGVLGLFCAHCLG